MDATQFDRLARRLSAAGSRRGLLRLLAALPAAGGAVALLAVDNEADARKKRKKKKRPCRPNSTAVTCEGKCGIVANNCNIEIHCRPCTCRVRCPVCQQCDSETNECVADPDKVDDPCGECRTCNAAGECAIVGDGTACNQGGPCSESGTCQGGVCTGSTPKADGTVCGDQQDGGPLRCCDGVCPDPGCISANNACGDQAACQVACCSGKSYLFIDGQRLCSPSELAEDCGSDFDCPFEGVQCRCGTCCVPPEGSTAGECLPEFCCSGVCAATPGTCL